jgi:hypothetical protein
LEFVELVEGVLVLVDGFLEGVEDEEVFDLAWELGFACLDVLACADTVGCFFCVLDFFSFSATLLRSRDFELSFGPVLAFEGGAGVFLELVEGDSSELADFFFDLSDFLKVSLGGFLLVDLALVLGFAPFFSSSFIVSKSSSESCISSSLAGSRAGGAAR